MVQQQTEGPRLTVVGGSANASSTGQDAKRMLVDGTAVTAAGGMMVGGFGVAAAQALLTGEPAGRWWLVLLFVVGLGLVGFGIWLRRRAARRVRVGIVLTAADSRRGLPRADWFEQQAEMFSRQECSLTLKSRAELTADPARDLALVDALAEQALAATAMAERLTPDATWIRLIPTMPLHAAFRCGAKLGYTFSRRVVVHAIRQAEGSPTYFPATVLRAVEPAAAPLTVDRLTTIAGGDPTVAAVALDLQKRGDQFFDLVDVACRTDRVGHLLRIRSTTTRLAENEATFTGAVEQICRAWLDAQLPAEARTGRHAIFLSGPPAIAFALGARLAAPEHARWTAYTLDPTNGTYEAFPPSPVAP